MLWKDKRRRILLWAFAVSAIALAGLVLYLRADKTAEFYATRGTYRGARVMESSASAVSQTRLVELYNDRGEAVASAYVRTPRQLADRYRILLTYAGMKTGQQILGLIPERSDVVLVAVQY